MTAAFQDIDEALAMHQKWVQSAGKEGKQLIADGISLAQRDLTAFDLSDCALANADFAGANLQGVKFSRSHLVNCNFQGARLDAAFFWRATLDGSDLRNTRIDGADFSRVSLVGANLSGLRFVDGQVDPVRLEQAILD